MALPVIELGAFGAAPRTAVSIITLVMHLLLAGAVLLLVFSAWRREWLGWVGALSMLGCYLWTKGAEVPWNDAPLISGGLPILGLLYAWNAERRSLRSPIMPPASEPVTRRDSGKEAWLQKRNSGIHSLVRDRASGEYEYDTLFRSTEPDPCFIQAR